MSGTTGNPSGRGSGACGARFGHMLRCVETRGSAAACAAEVDAFLACERAVFQAATRRGGVAAAAAQRQSGTAAAADGGERDVDPASRLGRGWPTAPPPARQQQARVAGAGRAGGADAAEEDEEDEEKKKYEDERWGAGDGEGAEGQLRSGPGRRPPPPPPPPPVVLLAVAQRELWSLGGMAWRAAATQGRACRELWGAYANERTAGKVGERCGRIAADAGKSAGAIAGFCGRGARAAAEQLRRKLDEWRDRDKE